MRAQERWEDHAAFMDGLADDGFIVLGGPLGDGTTFLHVVAVARRRSRRDSRWIRGRR